MPSLPPTVRESWGEQVADDFSHWLEQLLEERAVHRDEYREVLSRLDVLEERLGHIEKRFDRMEEHVDDRIDQMEARFDERLVQMEERFNERFEQVDQRFEQVDQRFEQVDQRFEQINQRFEQVDRRFEQGDQRFEGIDAKLDRMNDRILSMTRWLIGLIALFGTLVTALLGVAQFMG